ncbi:MAG: penicillin-binding protein 2 [Bacteroidetes bacterium]|nr:penicillin-binding protein 2 [Bacteroidota bacterium]
MKVKSYTSRQYVIKGLIIIIGLSFIVRLFILQVPKNSYKLSAENNVLRYMTDYPPRGLIYDRNGNLLVYNEPAYDLMVIPGQLSTFDTLELCNIIKISLSDFRNRLQKAKKYSRFKPSLFLEQISRQDYAYLAEKLFKYEGFFVQARTLRKYTGSIAAHTLGYVGEVTQKEIDRDDYYQLGDYIGKSGIEKSYESLLRGQKGVSVKVVDVHNREKGKFMDGSLDTVSVPGSNIQITIDSELQQYGEMLMENKIGSIVAIEPSSGEILALVTSPSYDPNLLVGRIRSINYAALASDSLNPLMNRAIMGTYSPGSTFKILNALIALQENVLTPETRYDCQGPETRPIRCSHHHVTPLELHDAIMHSCNPFFWKTFRSIITNPNYSTTKEAYTQWRKYAIKAGFGTKFNTDIPFELSGNISPAEYYDNVYGENHWTALTIRSLSIGQGEILVTPLQMANFACIVANWGYYFPPHLLRNIYGTEGPNRVQFRQKTANIDMQYFSPIVAAMNDVVDAPYGTAHWVNIPDIKICGKTGTVENPHGKDHSTFIAFAPRENPKIALAVIVENSGFGSTWAAPIASLMIEKYLTGEIKRVWIEDRLLNSNLLNRK